MARLIVTANSEGNIIALDGAVEEILGWTADELLGKPVTEIIPFKYREQHAAGWDRWQSTGKKSVMGTWLEVEARRADGNVVPVTFCVTERKDTVQAIIETPTVPGLRALDK